MRISGLLIAAMGLVVLGTTNAQEPVALPSAKAGARVDRVATPGTMVSTHRTMNPALVDAQSAAVDYETIDSLSNGLSYYTTDQTPLVWDPVSNLMATIKRGGPGDGNNLYIRTSSDMGLTWSAPIGPLHDLGAGNGRYPSVMIANPSGTTNPAEIYLIYQAPLVAGGAFGPVLTGMVTAAGGAPIATVVNTGIDGNTWGSDTKFVISNDGTMAIALGQLDGDQFGVRLFNIDLGTETSSVPAQFAGSNFRPGTTDGRYSTVVSVEKDNAGTIYAGILAYPASEEIRLRPAVSMSADNGATWSTLEYVPHSVFETYATAQGANPDSVAIPYRADFVVLGPDRYSFVTPMYEGDESRQTNFAHMVEIYKENGVWGIRKVADITPFVPSIDAGSGPGASQMGSEIQVEPTADGSRLVVKWLDFINYRIDGDFNGDGASPDTTQTTDIFLASRAASSGSWGSEVNVTEDVLFNRITWIPNILPNDLRNVVLLSVLSPPDDTETTDSAKLIGAQLQLIRTQHVTISHFDASGLSSVRSSSVAAARELAIYPNPATGEARATFTLPKAAEVSVEIYDLQGRRVVAMPNATMGAGTQSVAFSTSDLTEGVYYYTVKASGTTASAMFTVVR